MGLAIVLHSDSDKPLIIKMSNQSFVERVMTPDEMSKWGFNAYYGVYTQYSNPAKLNFLIDCLQRCGELPSNICRRGLYRIRSAVFCHTRNPFYIHENFDRRLSEDFDMYADDRRPSENFDMYAFRLARRL